MYWYYHTVKILLWVVLMVKRRMIMYWYLHVLTLKILLWVVLMVKRRMIMYWYWHVGTDTQDSTLGSTNGKKEDDHVLVLACTDTKDSTSVYLKCVKSAYLDELII